MKRIVRRLLGWLVYGGSRTLREYERLALEKVRDSLSPDDQRAFQAQVTNLEHLKRLHGDRMVTFYFDHRAEPPRLSNRGLEQTLGGVLLRAERKKVRATVVAHRGLLSSLEFSRSPVDLGPSVHAVSIDGEPRDPANLARAIDTGEHPPDDTRP